MMVQINHINDLALTYYHYSLLSPSSSRINVGIFNVFNIDINDCVHNTRFDGDNLLFNIPDKCIN